ncbi:hypothetical protein RRG08_062371 [Elysia crispata]|uniref:Uncharacterized protein n=1 Tax=Elysia crispata TaxID=231223 RepID=A0AAE1CYA8_9GAST|nr:hypothetical protein RRG08_062371 [Elysia crispata]
MSKSFSDKRGTKRRKRAVTVPFPALKALLCSVWAGAGACSEPTGNMAPKDLFPTIREKSRLPIIDVTRDRPQRALSITSGLLSALCAGRCIASCVSRGLDHEQSVRFHSQSMNRSETSRNKTPKHVDLTRSIWDQSREAADRSAEQSGGGGGVQSDWQLTLCYSSPTFPQSNSPLGYFRLCDIFKSKQATRGRSNHACSSREARHSLGGDAIFDLIAQKRSEKFITIEKKSRTRVLALVVCQRQPGRGR